MCAPVNRAKVEAILTQLRPGTTISFVRGELPPLPPETEARARALFGDKLVIE